jgi:death-on-curing protein
MDFLWIEERDALTLHDRLLALDGGATGVRDAGLLASALARPRQLHAYGKNPDAIDLAGAYTAGILRNHPFVDGNKRTCFVIGVLFLEMNGYRFVASEESATQAILGLASGALEEGAFVAWLRGNATAVGGRARKGKRE